MASPEPQQDSMDNEEPLKTKPGPVSFGFSKTISKVKTEKSERREFLSGIDGKELIGLPGSTKPVDKPKEFIIPLIQNSRSYRDDGVKTEAVKEAPSEQLDSVESQAIKELIEESQKQQERWHNDSHCDPNLVIPLILNQMSKGFEDGEHTKMELPDQQQQEASAEADYEQVPVKAYGLALMKGMGWKQEEGVGCKLKALTEAKEHQYRAKGLGLGADRTAIQEVKPSRPLKPGEEREPIDEGLVLGPGGCVLFQTGPHKDLYGKIEAVDPDNVRVQVKLAIGGVSVTASQHVVRLVPRKEYNRYCNDLSRLSKAHKEKVRECEKEKEQEKGRGCDQSRRTENANGKEEKGREKERQNNQEHDQRKRKNREADMDREKPQSVKESRSSLSSWIQRDLRVRFIDKTFKGGKYYNFKMRIEDVLAPYICVCRTDAGQLLDDIKQMMLETIVPKGDADYIMVVLGEHRGQVGRILKRDKERCRAMVQLERYEEKVFILDYDSICHYVGDH